MGVNFLGWSENGRYYAYEKIYPDTGGVSCPLTMELEIVDAKTDQFVSGSGYLRNDKLLGDESGKGCEFKTRNEQKIEFRYDINPLLKRWEITIGNYSNPQSIVSNDNLYEFSIDNQKYTFSFKSEDFQKLYPESEDIGIRYHLSWVKPLQRQIERGKKRLVYGYHFNSVFVSPNNQYAAFMIGKYRYFHEGQGLDMMSNGTPMPLNNTQDKSDSQTTIEGK